MRISFELEDNEDLILEEALKMRLSGAKGSEHEAVMKVLVKVLNSIEDSKDPNRSVKPYRERGFSDRESYLRSLAEDYGVSLSTVEQLSDMLGMEYDFSRLVDMLEQYNGADLEDDVQL